MGCCRYPHIVKTSNQIICRVKYGKANISREKRQKDKIELSHPSTYILEKKHQKHGRKNPKT